MEEELKQIKTKIRKVKKHCDTWIKHTGNDKERDIYINPEDGFEDFCVRIHGITKDKVKDERTFPEVWKEIEKYFTNAVIIGHNVAGADLDALVKTLKRYDLDIPVFYYVCTLDLAREYVPSYEVPNYSMSTLCEYFGVEIDSEHNAFDDACACADLFKAIVEKYDIDVNKIKDIMHFFILFLRNVTPLPIGSIMKIG